MTKHDELLAAGWTYITDSKYGTNYYTHPDYPNEIGEAWHQSAAINFTRHPQQWELQKAKMATMSRRSMPHDLNPDWEHVDDWLDGPTRDDDGERFAKEWLGRFREARPDGLTVKEMVAWDEERNRWLEMHPLFCTFDGEVYRVTGASRLGDIWLARSRNRTSGYDRRVNVAACSGWREGLQWKVFDMKVGALKSRIRWIQGYIRQHGDIREATSELKSLEDELRALRITNRQLYR
jgi:hypothetical protein